MSRIATVHGQVDAGKRRGATRRIVAVEETLAGYRLAGIGPCRTDLPRVRVVGITDTDRDGRFSIQYVPSEPPADACDWRASIRVEVFKGAVCVWTSTARHVDPVVEFRQESDDGTLAMSVNSCTVRGRLTACGRPAADLDVVASEKVTTGVDQPGEPCIPHSRTREVGRTVTDAAGAFTMTFQPTPDTGHCTFPSRVRVDVFDGETSLWQSQLRLIAANVDINGEIFPDCPAGASVVRVFDDDGVRVAGAEVYVDGARVGTTSLVGELHISPALLAGQETAARQLLHEQRSSRPEHSEGRDANWAYRVYITSVRVRYDANGDAVRLPLLRVDDPSQPVDVIVRRRNTLIGFNLTASIEWDATPEDRARLHDRLVETSELLYNATDGQFLIEQFHLSESAGRWDSADLRIYANLNQRSVATVNGVFGAAGRIRMNPNDAYYSGITFHELGHYVLGLRDEYEGDDWDPANGDVRCTLQSTDDDTPYSSGAAKDSCFMRGAQEANKKKLCSAHPDNPHVDGTDQGAQDCWSAVLGRYGGDRWRLQSPTTRGVIVGRLPDSGVPLRRTTEPPPQTGRDTEVPSFIPVVQWKPRVRSLIDRRGTLVERVVVRTELDGAPVRRQKVWLHQHTNGRRLLQGETRGSYRKAYGLQTGDGEVPLRGAHLDDEVSALGPAPNGGLLVGKAIVTRADPHTLVIPLKRIPLPFSIDLQPGGTGALGIRVRAAGDARIAPDIYIGDGDVPAEASGHLRIRPGDGVSLVGGLPRDGSATVGIVAVTANGDEIMDERGVTLSTVDEEAASVWSSDGRLKLRVKAGTFDEPHHLLIESPGADCLIDPLIGEVVSGPYRITTMPDDRWGRKATLLFGLPSPELPGRDPDEWIMSLVVVELELSDGGWRRHPSTARLDPAIVSAQIDHKGTYALMRPR